MILLFSDGDDTISKTSFRHVREKILESGDPDLCCRCQQLQTVIKRNRHSERLADDSGGRYVGLADGPVKILNDVMDDLHSGLLVTYALPDSTSEFHSIRILPTHNLNLQFRCRSGYYSRRYRQRPSGGRSMKRRFWLAFLFCSAPSLLAAQFGMYQHGSVVRMHMGDCMLAHRGMMVAFGPPSIPEPGFLPRIHTGVSQCRLCHCWKDFQSTHSTRGNYRLSFTPERACGARR